MSVFESHSSSLNYLDGEYRRFPRATDSCTNLLRRSKDGLVIPNGLVVSPDYDRRGHLGEALLLCAIAPLFASTHREAVQHISASPISVILCEDRLSDGSYRELLPLVRSFHPLSPLIVISPTGDWPDYFEAIDRGAYDFLAFPLIPGELQRIVTNHLKAAFQHSLPFDSLT